ncbi:hypothetical protein EJ08DRAFT_306050 [Tothia fuscella]|uniref:Uncharacterized protein n=1 Tax=Tothia fuscella TaxID=1048955 RepID=A0A9P4NPP4_9PEZI|nr:hypothetical protein EJ08DRAFT_306050 [Tothia fuscella]
MSSSNQPPKIALISGHIDLTTSELEKHYVPQIDAALQGGHHFVLGDAAGADTLALSYLLSQVLSSSNIDLRSRITMYPSRKHNISKFREQGLRVVLPDDPNLNHERTLVVVTKKGPDARRYHHIQRDANMTAATDYDILYVRSEEESRNLYGDKYRPRLSATEMNRMRREELAKLSSRLVD